MRKNKLVIGMVILAASAMVGCGDAATNVSESDTDKSQVIEEVTSEVIATTESIEQKVVALSKIELEDGVYTADFTTDSSMFHVNEANNGKGVLTVTDGKATIHVSLTSKNILNLYQGLVEDAAKEGATLLMPSLDTVKYSDGTIEEVNGFDIPVVAIDEEFDVALIGSKGKWYDHKVKVSNPEKLNENEK